MDDAQFTEKKSGQLVRITSPEEDWAFVPAPLPPRWSFSPSLWPLLVKAKEELARLDGIGLTLPNPQLLLLPLQHREALRSSSLEGTYATAKELLLFELHPRKPKSSRDRANEWLEVSNYGSALRQGMQLLHKLPLSLRVIRKLHSTLLEGVRGRESQPGEFRQLQVHVGSDRRFIPPPPSYLSGCLDQFEKRMNESDSQYDPLVRCYLLHYQFEAIHPFRDGNGRVGRVLLAIMIYKWCGLSLPWLYMSAYFERYKDEYIGNLFRVSTEGAWEKWVKFCLKGTLSQAQDSIRRCRALGALKKEFHSRATEVSVRSHTIIEELFAVPLISVSALAREHSVSYPTAKSDINRLVKLGLLHRLKDIYPLTYFAPDIMNIAYGEPDEHEAESEEESSKG
jgi:Fic family protein